MLAIHPVHHRVSRHYGDRVQGVDIIVACASVRAHARPLYRDTRGPLEKPPKIAILSILAAVATALHGAAYSYQIIAEAANGDPAYNFTASGTFSGPVDPYNSAGVDVTGITGSANGYDFLGVVNPGTTNSQTPGTAFGFTFDNVLYPANGGTHVDDLGILMYLNSPIGTSLAHVYYTGSGDLVDVIDPNEPGASTPFSVVSTLSISAFSLAATPSASSVPEPSTLLLLGSGGAGALGVVFRRRRALCPRRSRNRLGAEGRKLDA